MSEIEKLKDPLTGEMFIPRRITQRFASSKNQIAFNNLQAKKKRLAKAAYDKPLDKNRTIIKTLLAGKSEVTKSKEFLLGMGFDFSIHHSNYWVDKSNKVLATGIYEYVLVTTDKNNYTIKKK